MGIEKTSDVTGLQRTVKIERVKTLSQAKKVLPTVEVSCVLGVNMDPPCGVDPWHKWTVPGTSGSITKLNSAIPQPLIVAREAPLSAIRHDAA